MLGAGGPAATLPPAGHVWDGSSPYGVAGELVTPTRTDADPADVRLDTLYGDPDDPISGLWSPPVPVPPTPATPPVVTATQARWVPCSPEGAGLLNVAMLWGQAGVVGIVRPGSRIRRIEVRYQSHDRRYIRGTRGIPKEEE